MAMLGTCHDCSCTPCETPVIGDCDCCKCTVNTLCVNVYYEQATYGQDDPCNCDWFIMRYMGESPEYEGAPYYSGTYVTRQGTIFLELHIAREYPSDERCAYILDITQGSGETETTTRLVQFPDDVYEHINCRQLAVDFDVTLEPEYGETPVCTISRITFSPFPTIAFRPGEPKCEYTCKNMGCIAKCLRVTLTLYSASAAQTSLCDDDCANRGIVCQKSTDACYGADQYEDGWVFDALHCSTDYLDINLLPSVQLVRDMDLQTCEAIFSAETPGGGAYDFAIDDVALDYDCPILSGTYLIEQDDDPDITAVLTIESIGCGCDEDYCPPVPPEEVCRSDQDCICFGDIAPFSKVPATLTLTITAVDVAGYSDFVGKSATATYGSPGSGFPNSWVFEIEGCGQLLRIWFFITQVPPQCGLNYGLGNLQNWPAPEAPGHVYEICLAYDSGGTANSQLSSCEPFLMYIGGTDSIWNDRELCPCDTGEVEPPSFTMVITE